MTEPTTPAQSSSKNSPPLVRGYTREGQTPAEITLWMNDRAGDNDRAPDMRGTVKVGNETVSVSAWVRPGGTSATTGKPYGPFVSIAANINDGTREDPKYRSEQLGTVQAMLKFKGEEVDGSKGLKLIGELKGETVLKGGATVTGNLNSRFPDADHVIACATELGFGAKAIEGFKTSMEEDKKKAPRP